MKKVWLLLGLLALAMFVVGCAKEVSVDDELAQGDLTPEEKAQLPADLKTEEKALAGQAVKWENCADSDNPTSDIWNAKEQLLTKSKTTYETGFKEDKCFTFNKGTPKEKTRLIEGVCKKVGSTSRFNYWYADCENWGKDYTCKNGACVPDLSKTCENSCIISYEWGDTKEIVSLPLNKIAMLKNKGFFDQLYIETTEAFELTNNYCKLSTHACTTKDGDYDCKKSPLKLFLSKQEGNTNTGFFTLEGIKCDNFKYEMYKNGASIENSDTKTYPPKVLSCMDSDYEGIYTKETVVEYSQEKDGSVSKKEYTDSCSNENTLKEFVCINGIHESKSIDCQQGCKDGACDSGNLNVVGKKIPLSESPLLPDLYYPTENELEITPVELSSEKIKVLVPEGYEAYGQKMVTDLSYCSDLVPKFIGISSYWGEIGTKVYISKDGSSLGSQGNGWLFYKRCQECIDIDLKDVKENTLGGFLFKSSPEYCANTHEFVHYVVDFTIIPDWANEGIAEYTQKTTQAGSKDDIECQENGWVGFDNWGDDIVKKFFPYSDLSEEIGPEFGAGNKWYITGLCFWEFFDNKFGEEKRKEAFQLLRNKYTADLDKYQTYKLKDGTLISVPDKTSFFIENVLFEVVDKNELEPLLEKFGFNEGEDYGLSK